MALSRLLPYPISHLFKTDIMDEGPNCPTGPICLYGGEAINCGPLEPLQTKRLSTSVLVTFYHGGLNRFWDQKSSQKLSNVHLRNRLGKHIKSHKACRKKMQRYPL